MSEKYIPRHSMKFAEHPEKGTERTATRSRKMAREAISIVATGVIGGGSALGAVGAYFTNDPLALPREIIGSQFDRGPEPVSPAIKREITKEMAAVRGTEIRRSAEVPEHDAVVDFRIAEAKNFGLHVEDSRKYEKSLSEVTSVDDGLAVMNQYASKFGITVTMPSEFDRIHAPAASTQTLFTSRDFTPKQLNEFKSFGADMLAGMSALPREAYELADVDEIRLVDRIQYEEDTPFLTTSGVAEVSLDSITLAAHITSPWPPSHTIRHELEHQMTSNMPFSNTGWKRDESFTKLNDPATPYGTKFDSDESAQHYGYITSYAGTKVIEDEADTFAGMFNIATPSYQTDESPYDQFSKPIHNKFVETLGRFEERVPNLGVFFARTAPYATPSVYYIAPTQTGAGG